jgi:hypothetical protein
LKSLLLLASSCVLLGGCREDPQPLESITILPPTIPDGIVGSPYQVHFTATGTFTAPLGWSELLPLSDQPSRLPVGFHIDRLGAVLSGTPTRAGTYLIGIQAHDSNTAVPHIGKIEYTLTIHPAGQIVISTGSLPDGVAGASYSAPPLQSTGGQNPVSWDLAPTSQPLPTGLNLNALSGVISGTPKVTGTFPVTVRVTDTALPQPHTATRDLSITLTQALAVNAILSDGINGISYAQTLTATGAVGPTSWAITPGTLPGGLGIDTNSGLIGGIPNTDGTFTFTAQVTDTGLIGVTASKQFMIHIVDRLLISSPSSLPDALGSQSYSFALQATGGLLPLSWTLANNTLPPGLSLDAAGNLSGIPLAVGTFTFDISVSDSLQTQAQSDRRTFQLSVNSSSQATTSRISVDTMSRQADLSSFNPSASQSGRFVAFESDATNLTRDSDFLDPDTNHKSDIFVRDTCVGELPGCSFKTIRLSVQAGPFLEGNDDSTGASINADGRYVAFRSFATNLLPVATSGNAQIYFALTCLLPETGCVRGTVGMISRDPGGLAGNASSAAASMSASGRYVAFQSDATNLVAGDSNAHRDVFLRDTCVGEPASANCSPSTIRISLPDQGGQADDDSSNPAVSADGRYVAFVSKATNLLHGVSLVVDDTNGVADIYVRDTCIGAVPGCIPTTVRASLANDGTQTAAASSSPAISANGRLITFVTTGDLTSNPTGAHSSVYLRDTCATRFNSCTPSTTLVSANNIGNSGDADSGGNSRPSISADGGYVAFDSDATNLDAANPGDNNGLTDVFVRDTCFSDFHGGCQPTTRRVSRSSLGIEDGTSSSPSISGDGLFVTFASRATNLVTNDTNAALDIFGINVGFDQTTTLIPFLTSILPSSVPVGTQAFTVAVFGNSFVPESLVYWDNCASTISCPSPRTTIFAGPDKLLVRVLESDLAVQHPVKITVVNPPIGGGTSNALDFIVGGLFIFTTSLPAGTIGQPYDQTLRALDGTQPYVWSISEAANSGRLPNGVNFDAATGRIQGTPTEALKTTPIFVVTDAASATASAALAIVINNVVPTLTNLSPTSALFGTPVSLTLTGTNFNSTSIVNFDSRHVTGGIASPDGTTLTINIPTIDLSFVGQIMVSVTNPEPLNPSGDTTTALPFNITAPPFSILTSSPLSSGRINQSYSQTLQSQGGIGTLTWTVALGQLPAGLSLTTTGTIEGSPTAMGTATFTVQVADSTPPTPRIVQKTFEITINAPPLFLTTTSLPTGTVNLTYGPASLVATGGTPPFTWSISVGALPPGLNLDANTGGIAGTPLGPAGTVDFTAKVTDQSLPTQSATQALSIAISSGPVGIVTSSLFGGTAGSNYSQTLSANGGSGSYTWSLATGSFLPSGLSLTPDGVLSGTPDDGIANATFTVKVADSNAPSNSATKQFTLTINNPVPQIAGISPSMAAAGRPDFAMTVNGVLFVRSSVVRWNGVDLITTFSSSTQLSAIVPAPDTASPGSVAVTVFNPAPAGGNSNTATFTINVPDPGVVATLTHDTGQAMKPDITQSGRFTVYSFFSISTATSQVLVQDTSCLAAVPSCPPVRMDVDNDGNPSTGGSNDTTYRGEARITPDGRFVAFATTATFATLQNTFMNGGKSGTLSEVYLRDRDVDGNGIFDEANSPGQHDKSRTYVISINAAGSAPASGCITPGACSAVAPGLSADGRFVVFEGSYTDLDTASSPTPISGQNIFLRDTCFGTVPGSCTPSTMLVSLETKVITTANPNNPLATRPAISPDGQWIAYAAQGRDLIPGHTLLPSTGNIFAYDTCADPTDQYCVPSASNPGPGNKTVLTRSATGNDASNGLAQTGFAFSGDGRFVAFGFQGTGLTSASAACPAVIPTGNFVRQVMVRNRDVDANGVFDEANTSSFDKTLTCIASLDNSGNLGTADSANGESISISLDGRVVSFNTTAPNLIVAPTVNTNREQAVARDTCFGASSVCAAPQTFVISQKIDGALADPTIDEPLVGPPRLSGDAGLAAFSDFAANLATPATSGTLSNLYLSQTSIAIPAASTPATTSLAPASVAHGPAEITLTVRGTGFTPDSIVQWNGSDRATSFLSPTKLFVRILAADLATAGSVNVRACTAGACSSSISFTIN